METGIEIPRSNLGRVQKQCNNTNNPLLSKKQLNVSHRQNQKVAAGSRLL